MNPRLYKKYFPHQNNNMHIFARCRTGYVSAVRTNRAVVSCRYFLGCIRVRSAASWMGSSNRNSSCHCHWLSGIPRQKYGSDGLWGFNGTLVGCALPAFLANTTMMWVTLIFFAMLTTWLQRGLNRIMLSWKIKLADISFRFSHMDCTYGITTVQRTATGNPYCNCC